MKLEFNGYKVLAFIGWTLIALLLGYMAGYDTYPKVQVLYNQMNYAEGLAILGLEHPRCEDRLWLYRYDAACSSDLFKTAINHNKALNTNCTVWSGSFYFWFVEHNVANREILFNTNHRSFVVERMINTKYYVTRASGEPVGQFDDFKEARGHCNVCGINNPNDFAFNRKEDDMEPYVQHCCSLDDGFKFKWRVYLDCEEGLAFASSVIGSI